MSQSNKKEYVKLHLLKQFNNKNSTLRYLLSGKKGLVHSKEQSFYCSEHSFRIDTEEIDTNNLKISFTDIDLSDPMPYECLDLSDNYELHSSRHVFETIEFKNNQLIFAISNYYLYQDDYQFMIREFERGNSRKLVFDIKQMCFMPNDKTKDADDFIEQCMLVQKSEEVRYHEYPVRSFKLACMDKFEFPDDMDERLKEQFKIIFRNNSGDGSIVQLISKMDMFCIFENMKTYSNK